jgi:CRP-like cAMP-binding protein
MSLLTGEPRAASVIAESETEVIVVDKPDLAEVFKSDNALLESISLVLEQRVRRSAERVAAGSGPLMKKESPQQLALLQRIRGFFGIKPQ